MVISPAIHEAPLICGIDYSSKALDVALVRGSRLISVDTHELGTDMPSRVAVVARIVMDLARKGAVVVVMEERWVRAEKGIAAAMKVRDVSTGVYWLAIAAGLKLEFVPINTWHRTVLGDGGLKRAEAKHAAKLYVERVYGRKLSSDNQADAVCLGAWAAMTLKLELARRQNGARR